MVFGIKFNYPHAFFLSVGVVLFVFGASPFYLNDFDFASMHWTRIIIHAGAFVASIVSLMGGDGSLD